MNALPLWFYIRIMDKGRKVLGLWLPVPLIWLLLLPFVLLTFTLILTGDLLTAFKFRLTRLLAGVLGLIMKINGTTVKIKNPNEDSSVLVHIR